MAKMTKAQLVDENIRLRIECDRLESQLGGANNLIKELDEQIRRKDIALGKLTDGMIRNNSQAERPAPSNFHDYWSYVGACRAWHRARGIKVVSYLDRDQWAAARAGH